MNKFVRRKNKMRKSDFIANTERWLVRNDIKVRGTNISR